MLRYLIFLTCLLGSGYGTTNPPQGDLTTADIQANFSALWTELRQLRQEIQTHVYGGHILTPRNGYYPSGVHSHEDHDHQDGDAHHHHHGLHSKENHNETDGSDHSEHDHHDSDTHSHDHYDDHHHHDHHHSEHPQGNLSGYPQPHVHDFIYPIHQHRSIHSHNHKEGENDTEKHVGHHHYGHYHGMPYGYGESHYHPEGDHGHTHGGEDHHHRDIHLDGHDHDHEGDTSSESGEVNHDSLGDHHHEHQDEHQDHGHDHTHEHDHDNPDHTHEHDHDNHDHTQGHDHDHHDHDHGDSHHNHDDHDHHDHGYHMGLWPRPLPHHGYHGRPHVLLNPNYYMGYPILARKTPKAFCHLLPNAEIDSKVKGHVSINPQTDGENGTIFEVDITGIVISEDNPHKKHGFHIHENKIVDQKCSSAGGHYNPTNQDHGAPDAEIRHVGDLGNIDVDENGKVFHKIIKDDIAEIYGPDTIIGKSIVIHELEDDLGLGGNEESLKTGNAGRRLACCTIQSIQAARRTQIRFN